MSQEFEDRYLYFDLREEAKDILLQFAIVIFYMYSPFFSVILGSDSSGFVALFLVGDSLCYIFLITNIKVLNLSFQNGAWEAYTSLIHKHEFIQYHP